jgi:hypothetical protein
MLKSTNYEAPLYAVFSVLLLPPSEVQIFSSALDSQIHSVASENNVSHHTVQKCMMWAFKRLFLIQIVTVILVGLWSTWMWYCVVWLILEMRCVVVSLTWPVWGPTDYFPFQCLFTLSLFSLTLSPYILPCIIVHFPPHEKTVLFRALVPLWLINSLSSSTCFPYMLHTIFLYLAHLFCPENGGEGFYEGFVHLYQTAWCHSPEDFNLNSIHCHDSKHN